jgi:hypothetical protein
MTRTGDLAYSGDPAPGGGAPSITLCVQFSPQRGARTTPMLDDVGTTDNAGAAGMAVIHA